MTPAALHFGWMMSAAGTDSEWDAERHANVPGYRPFYETHKRRRLYCNPDNLRPSIDASLFGSAETVRVKLRRLLDAGYNHIILIRSIPIVPAALRQDWLTRFARGMMTHFQGRGSSGVSR